MMESQFSGTTDEVRTEPEGLAELLVLSGDALDMEDEDVDASFDLGSSLSLIRDHIIGTPPSVNKHDSTCLMMALAAVTQSTLSAKPNQPKPINFPRRSFGKKAGYFRNIGLT